MTESTNESGTTPTTNQTPSGDVVQATPAANLGGDVLAQLKSLGERLERTEQLARTLQGNKDRNAEKVEKFEGSLKSLISEWESAKQKGMDPDEFAWRKKVDNMIDGATPQVPTNSPQGSGADEAVALTKAIFAEAGLDDNSAEVLNWMKTQFATKEEAMLAASKIAIQKLKAPKATPAETPAPVSGNSPQEVKPEELVAKLKKLQANPSANWDEIAKIEKQLGW